MSYQAEGSLKRLRDRWIRNFGGQEVSMLEHAYELATYCHDGQQRRSGDPYISHCLAVAEILLVEGASPAVVCAGLLHDALDFRDGADLVRAEARAEVAGLVESVTVLDREADPARISALNEDVLTIALADRLHNARTWEYISLNRVEFKAHQSLSVHVGIARRLGLGSLGGELQRRSEYRLQQVARLRDAGVDVALLDLSTMELASRPADSAT